ncbi:SemiSWEET family transporter [Atopobiaceae bacterium 24-176]
MSDTRAPAAAPTDAEIEKRWIRRLSYVATGLAVMMYVSYIPQIMNNLAGQYGSPWQPLVACVACTLWVVYGFCKLHRDWALVAANAPGIVFGLITFLTSLH